MSYDYMGEGKSIVDGQAKAIMSVPYIAFSYWPAFFTFSIVGYLERMVVKAIPNTTGSMGIVVRAAVNGMTKVVDHATWQAVQNTSATQAVSTTKKVSTGGLSGGSM